MQLPSASCHRKNYNLRKYNNYNSISNFNIKYPTILIDEIQDYKPSWIKLISDVFLEENGELVVFFGRLNGSKKTSGTTTNDE